MLAAYVCCEAVARVLKNGLKQHRPLASCQALGVCLDHGMPSSHSQMMLCMAVLQTLIARARWRGFSPGSRALVTAEVAVLWLLAALVPIARVYLGYHDIQQVLVGAYLGTCIGGLAFRGLVHLSPYFNAISNSPLLAWLHVRNTWPDKDIQMLERRWSQETQVKAKDS